MIETINKSILEDAITPQQTIGAAVTVFYSPFLKK
jgi:hypothetical protein